MLKAILTAFILGALIIGLLAIHRATSENPVGASGAMEDSLLRIAGQDRDGGCRAEDIGLTIHRIGFANACRRTPCITLKGTATLENRCQRPIGVEVEITGYDRRGIPVATRRLWPFSTSNVAPGKHTFSLDHFLDYDSDITTFSIAPARVRRW